MNTELTFRTHTFTPAIRDNKFWLTSSQIAEALEYSSTKSISNLYNQNEDEFTPEMTQVTESVTSGNYRKKVRIFSLRGAHLIAMFARTPVAKEFRRWVLDVLDREVGDPVVQPISLAPVYPSFSDNHANRAEIIYYQDFKPIYCRVLRSDERVITHESMEKWLESRGLVFFTREELRGMTLEKLLTL